MSKSRCTEGARQATLFKVLVNRRSCHGGLWHYRLGEWTPSRPVSCCTSGWHLTADPLPWWRPGAAVYLAEGRGRMECQRTKVAFASIRLLYRITLRWPLLPLFPRVHAFVTLSSQQAPKPLSCKNLQDASLHGADLQCADLAWSDLKFADLSAANLCRANLRDADLRWTRFDGAMMRGADLSGADLRHTVTDMTNWTDANLTGVLRMEIDQHIPGWVRDDRGMLRRVPHDAM